MGCKTITFDEWEKTYKPRYVFPRGRDGLAPSDSAPFNGYMFKTHSAEHEKVDRAFAANSCTVWTLYDNLEAESGYHVCNRLGYAICEVPFDAADSILVESGKCGNQHGLYCPKCGDSEALQLRVSTLVDLCPDGCGDTRDMEWDDSSYARCTACNWDGTVGQLTHKEGGE